ncbi:MAG: 30S ribosomal protein S4e [Thermoplasmata archaeon]
MSKHNKRYNSPAKRWGIPTKKYFWAPKVRPGKHSKDRGVPLVVLLRDILEYANNAREARHIIGDRKILIDGKPVTDHKAPVGLMDVISIPDIGEHYRMMFDQHGRIRLMAVSQGQEVWKLCRIENKIILKDGEVQYNLHDGRNFRSKDTNAFKTKDVLKLEVPDQQLIENYPFDVGSMAMITGGKHIGELGRIKEHEVIKSSRPNMVHFEEGFTTVEDYVFVVGKDKPVIEIPEVGIL